MKNHVETQQEREMHQSLILRAFSYVIEWGNRWLTLSGWILKKEKKGIFIKLELLILMVTAFCISLLFWIHLLSPTVALIVAFLLIQRLVEFVIIYSRNFILTRGKIYSHFHDKNLRGQWLLIMFGLNILQLLFIFAAWYRLISLRDPLAFSEPLNTFQSLYFSVVTFMTLGHAQMVPLQTLPQVLVILQSLFFFFTLVVVINGIIAMHFKKR